MERLVRDGTLGQSQSEEGYTAKFLVRVTAVRKRLIDEDNLCEKYHVDCLRYAGIIRDDEPAETHIEVRQRKARTTEVEHVIIEVFQLNYSPVSSEE